MIELAHPPRQRGRVRRLVHLRHDDRELVAAQPRHRVRLARATAQPIGDQPQQLVADGVAERVVDALELVEIETEHGQALAAFDALELVLQHVAQQHAVRKIGQRIVPRHVRDAFLGALALGDVLVGREPAAAFDRLADDRMDAPVGQIQGVGESLAGRHLALEQGDVVVRILGKGAGRGLVAQQVLQRTTGLGGIGRQPVHLGVARIAERQLGVGVEHQHALQQIVQHGLQQALAALRHFREGQDVGTARSVFAHIHDGS